MLDDLTKENQSSLFWWDIKNPEKPEWVETRKLPEFQAVCSSLFDNDEIDEEEFCDYTSHYPPVLERYREFEILWDSELWVVIGERAWKCEIEYEYPEKAYNIACEFIDQFWQAQPSPGQMIIPGLEKFCQDLRK